MTAVPVDTPAEIVSIVAGAMASEATRTKGFFRVVRSGPITSPLMVYYHASGDAVAGTDYIRLSGSVTIAAGASTAPIDVTPVDRSTTI